MTTKKKSKDFLLIGISSCFFYPDKDRQAFSLKTLQYMEKQLVLYIGRENVMPVLVPDVPEKLLRSYMKQLDGLVMHGGADMSPKSYGEDHIDEEKWPGDPRRDQYDLTLLRLAFKMKKPILGICRGCQVINVFFGGTLYQDLLTQKEASLVHRDATVYDQLSHQISFRPDGVLAPLYRENTKLVNTVHHQGIKTLGPDLRVEATCPEDGQVEAISYKDMEKQFVMGVQWHPEFSQALGDKIICPKPLMDLFLKRCAEVKIKQKKKRVKK